MWLIQHCLMTSNCLYSVFFNCSCVLRLLYFIYCNPLLLEYYMMYNNLKKKGKLCCIPLCFWGLSGSSSHLISSIFQLWPPTSAWTSLNMTSCCSSSQEQLMEPRVTHSYSSWDARIHTFGVSQGRILLQKTNTVFTHIYLSFHPLTHLQIVFLRLWLGPINTPDSHVAAGLKTPPGVLLPLGECL